jgi:hypothetical protein
LEDHLSSGIGDQPRQHRKISSKKICFLKVDKLLFQVSLWMVKCTGDIDIDTFNWSHRYSMFISQVNLPGIK